MSTHQSDSFVYNILEIESHRIRDLRKESKDLYVKDSKGQYIKVAEAFHPRLTDIKNAVFNKPKMRYFITFMESMATIKKMSLSHRKILDFLIRKMDSVNTCTKLSLRDISLYSNVSLSQTAVSIKEMLALDIIQEQEEKNTRNYMVNPAICFKGKPGAIFKAVHKYQGWKREEVKNPTE